MAFPSTPLDVLTELLLNGTWTDISQFVYTREPITITAGRSDEGQRVEPSRCQLTLNNRDGRFSARNPMSPYYGQLGRNTPIRVSVAGEQPYLLLDGDATTFASTPDTAALDITGDLDVRIDVRLDAYLPSEVLEMCGKYRTASSQRSWRMVIRDGRIFAGWSTTGADLIEQGSNEETPFSLPTSGRIALRYTLDVDNGLGGWTVTYYTAPTAAGPWTQLDQVVTTAGTTSIFNSTSPLDVGGIGNLAFTSLQGRLYSFELLSGIDGTAVANPDFTAQPAGTTSFADDAGRTWTLEGAAEITDREPRFTGEVSSWPPRWDVSGNDVWTPIEAAGVMRRLGQGNKALDSTLRRAVPSFEPLAYWPMEEGADAVQAYSPIAGVAPLKLEGVTWAQADTLASSLALPVLASSTGVQRVMSGTVPEPPAGWTGWQVRWVYRNDTPDSVTYWTFMRILCSSGTVREWFIQSREAGSRIRGYDIDGVLVFEVNVATSGDLFNQWVAVDFHAEQNGANVDWRIDWQDVGGDAGGIGASFAGTLGRVTSVSSPEGGFAAELDGMAIGHISVWPTTSSAAYDGAITGWDGETAADRLGRLASEETRLAVGQVPGDVPIATEAMGPQRPAELLELLRECADSDGGILHEDREHLALVYRHRASLYNQTPMLSLDYNAAGEVGPPLEPVEDDQRLRNDITVTRSGGSSGRVVIEEGPLSVLAPEDGGVGIYDEAVTLSLSTDAQTEPIAGWRAHLGTWDEARYPSIRLMLHAAPHLIPDWLTFRIGDKGVITNPPAWLPPDDIEFLGQGYTEVLDQYTWDVIINATPARPWSVAALDDADTRLDTAGSELTAAVAAADTTFTVLMTDGPLWADSATYASDFPLDLKVGGEEVTVTACTSGAVDAFGRTVASGWGTADVGGTWTTSGGSASDYSVGSSRGVHTLTTVNVSRRSVLTAPGADVDLYVDIATSALATGGFISGGIAARYLDSSNMYLARLAFNPSGTIELAIRKRVGGVETQLNGLTLPLTHTAGTSYRVRLQADGSTLRARAWLASRAEPGVWHIETTDTDLTAAGSIGCRSILSSANTNLNPEVRYDTFTLTNPQRMTVTRSVNGIVKSHAAGASIALAHPTYIAL